VPPAWYAALDPAELYELLKDQRRQNTLLRAELSAVREQLAELLAELREVRGQLAVLDRDGLRAERRDRELLDAVYTLLARDPQLRAEAERLQRADAELMARAIQGRRRWPWQRRRAC
jgi:hypothetical protein